MSLAMKLTETGKVKNPSPKGPVLVHPRGVYYNLKAIVIKWNDGVME